MSRTTTTVLCAGAAALFLLMPETAWAQGGADIAGGLQRGYQWWLTAVRVVAAIGFSVGFVMFAFGAWRYTGGIIMAACFVGAVKGDAMAQYLMGS